MLLGVAIWNGFPLVFYDTGAYLVEGLQGAFLVERSPVYSLFLAATGSVFSLWPVVILQSALTAYVLWEVARIEVPRLTPMRLLRHRRGADPADGHRLVHRPGRARLHDRPGGAGRLSAAVPQPNAGHAAGRLVIGDHRPGRRLPSFASGLDRRTAALWLADGHLLRTLSIPGMLPRLAPGAGCCPPCRRLLLALSLIVASNFALARSVFISRSGSVFRVRAADAGRHRQAAAGRYAAPAPTRPTSFAPTRTGWPPAPMPGCGATIPASRPRAASSGSQEEDRPHHHRQPETLSLVQLRAAIYDSVLQFFMFKTGDGIESQEWILKPEISSMMPRQLHAYLEARQQHNSHPFPGPQHAACDGGDAVAAGAAAAAPPCR